MFESRVFNMGRKEKNYIIQLGERRTRWCSGRQRKHRISDSTHRWGTQTGEAANRSTAGLHSDVRIIVLRVLNQSIKSSPVPGHMNLA